MEVLGAVFEYLWAVALFAFVASGAREPLRHQRKSSRESGLGEME